MLWGSWVCVCVYVLSDYRRPEKVNYRICLGLFPLYLPLLHCQLWRLGIRWGSGCWTTEETESKCGKQTFWSLYISPGVLNLAVIFYWDSNFHYGHHKIKNKIAFKRWLLPFFLFFVLKPGPALSFFRSFYQLCILWCYKNSVACCHFHAVPDLLPIFFCSLIERLY